ncbi:hypothetical protein B0H66DRAFT_107624 [Apodospora peruviana]|uniref:Uncharacterized protein n=1 Tax=Apodospora peruviana TaxID=516989 RepID=A0AAE0IHR7_9PEZI|nr:hypothetical protein B0H66DRAFT_107624 [Apodospora peruviana]
MPLFSGAWSACAAGEPPPWRPVNPMTDNHCQLIVSTSSPPSMNSGSQSSKLTPATESSAHKSSPATSPSTSPPIPPLFPTSTSTSLSSPPLPVQSSSSVATTEPFTPETTPPPPPHILATSMNWTTSASNAISSDWGVKGSTGDAAVAPSTSSSSRMTDMGTGKAGCRSTHVSPTQTISSRSCNGTTAPLGGCQTRMSRATTRL